MFQNEEEEKEKKLTLVSQQPETFMWAEWMNEWKNQNQKQEEFSCITSFFTWMKILIIRNNVWKVFSFQKKIGISWNEKKTTTTLMTKYKKKETMTYVKSDW